MMNGVDLGRVGGKVEYDQNILYKILKELIKWYMYKAKKYTVISLSKAYYFPILSSDYTDFTEKEKHPEFH